MLITPKGDDSLSSSGKYRGGDKTEKDKGIEDLSVSSKSRLITDQLDQLINSTSFF